jgi:hypothetical protein
MSFWGGGGGKRRERQLTSAKVRNLQQLILIKPSKESQLLQNHNSLPLDGFLKIIHYYKYLNVTTPK